MQLINCNNVINCNNDSFGIIITRGSLETCHFKIQILLQNLKSEIFRDVTQRCNQNG